MRSASQIWVGSGWTHKTIITLSGPALGTADAKSPTMLAQSLVLPVLHVMLAGPQPAAPWDSTSRISDRTRLCVQRKQPTLGDYTVFRSLRGVSLCRGIERLCG